jgi:HSP20 family molecular chaperone IbpA
VIAVHNEDKGKNVPSRREPVNHLMKSIDDFFQSKPLRGAMDSIDDFFQRTFVPTIPIDLFETKDELVIKAEIPGVKREQIYLDIEGNILRISVEHEEDHEVKQQYKNSYYRRERSYHRAERHVQLPYPVSEKQVKASYQNGVLTIKAPRGNRKRNRIQIEDV